MLHRPSADLCHPTLCALGAMPHAHCVCGLPMTLDAALCALCRAEGLVLDQVLTDDHEVEWDGRRRASRRRRWPVGAPIARYEDLLQTVLNPADRGRPRTSTGEAA